MNSATFIQNRNLLVTCGTGGVGKTTLSTAFAIQAAETGKKALVITIDPAKRLETSLGISGIGDQAKDLTEALWKVSPAAKNSGGNLFAMMPEPGKTFEHLLESFSPNEAFTQKIKQNKIFQMISRDYSGSTEIMAIFKLVHTIENGGYDFIVLDTPPHRNLVAFLNAPDLLARFYEEKLIRWMVMPANRLFSTGIKKVFGLLEHLTGKGFVSELFEFTAGMFTIQEGFTRSLKKMRETFQSPKTGFILVSSPYSSMIDELGYLGETLERLEYPLAGIVLNRSLLDLPSPSNPMGHLNQKALELIESQKQTETELIQELNRRYFKKDSENHRIFCRLPEMGRDIHSLEDLIHVAHALDRGTRTSNI